MKRMSKNIFIWSIWLFTLLIISFCYSLQSVHDVRPLLVKLPHSVLVCGIPYMFFTLFYVIALITKQFFKIPLLLLIDIIGIVLVGNNFGYFYEGSQAILNSLLVAVSIMAIRIIILVFKKCPKK